MSIRNFFFFRYFPIQLLHIFFLNLSNSEDKVWKTFYQTFFFSRSRSIRKKSSGRLMKRDGSADTSRDIDDIEDFEFDGGVDELVHDDEDLPEDDLDRETMKRSSLLLLESPDLAYVSMNPSADEFSKWRKAKTTEKSLFPFSEIL